MAPIGERDHLVDPRTPPDQARFEPREHERPKGAAVNLRPRAFTRLRDVFMEDVACGEVAQPLLLILVASQGQEFVKQASSHQRELAIIRMEIEGATLVPGRRRYVSLEDVEAPTVADEAVGSHESAGACADDCDGWMLRHEDHLCYIYRVL